MTATLTGQPVAPVIPLFPTPANTTGPNSDPAPAPNPEPRPGSRIHRARMPSARQVAVETAIQAGVCIRPVPLRRIDLDTAETRIVDVPCGSTQDSVCPACARKARALRAQQCREGWHLETEPDLSAEPSTSEQRALLLERAHITAELAAAEHDGNTLLAQALTESLTDVDHALAEAGVRGNPDPTPTRPQRRTRSTRRRQDTPDLPRRPSDGTTLGRIYTDPTNPTKTFRPSTFLTVTLPSYGRIRPGEGTPINPTTYDYPRAARDALHFSKLLDRLVQNLRRVAGYDLQYFAAIEPQKRLAPHAHFAIRGTLPRATIRQIIAATYHQVWWPPTDTVIYHNNQHPIWNPQAGPNHTGGFVDPDTGTPLPTWDEALDAIGPDDEPTHVTRLGNQHDIQGVLAGTPTADHYIGYLVKYLTKHLGDNLNPHPHDHEQDHEQKHADPAAAHRWATHRDRLVDALHHEPCSPTCPNWLRYGIQPKNAKPHHRPGTCRSKAHKPTHLGYAGRRVLVSRKWTGKTLTDHRADRRAHVHTILGLPPPNTTPHTPQPPIAWEHARTTDPDVPPLPRRLLTNIAHHHQRQQQYRTARDALPRPPEPPRHPTTPQPAPTDSAASSDPDRSTSVGAQPH